MRKFPLLFLKREFTVKIYIVEKTDKEIKVLFVSGWYPNRQYPSLGAFVRKHAEAANLYCDVTVLYVYPDENIHAFEIVEQKHNDLREIIVYYPFNTKYIFYKIFKTINYVRAYRKGYEYIIRKGFSPDVVQVNVLTRTGVMAYLHKLWKGVPYAIIEHWSRYLPARAEYSGFIRKKLTEKVVKHAAAVLPVSVNLQKAMLNHKLHNPNYMVIHNVVDDSFLEKKEVYPRTKKRILHVSRLDDHSKNINGLLRVISELSDMRNDFEVVIIGRGFDKVPAYALTLGLSQEVVSFLGRRATPGEMAEWFNNCDFFVLFSNYETASVVILESLVSGKPVVTTNVGGVPEYVNDTNGIVIPIKDEAELLKSLNYMLDNFQHYDSEKIRQEARKKYTYAKVGKELADIYSQILKR